MQTKFKLFLFLSIFQATFASAQNPNPEILVDSRINAVTLYMDRADVTREAKLELKAGKNILIFNKIPQSINSDSLSVNGKGAKQASIISVEYKNRFLKEDVNSQVKVLEEKLENFKQDLQTATRGKERLESQRKLVYAVSLDAKMPNDAGTVLRPRTSVEMDQVLKFINENTIRIDAELKNTELKIGQLNKDIDLVNRELSNLGSNQKYESVVEVTLESESKSNATLNLSYQVSNASWNPTYNLLVLNDPELKIDLESFALISQNTGEDWQDVELTLSTARPHLGLYRPHLGSKVLDIYQVVAMSETRSNRALSKKHKMDFKALESQVSSDDMEELDSLAVAGNAPMQSQLAQVIEGAVIVYKISSPTNLKSDGSVEKIKVTNSQLKGSLINVVVPEQNLQVFREAKIQNTSSAPILPGLVNLFYAGNFVGKQQLDFMPLNKEVKLPIGLADDIYVLRKQTKRFEDDSGIVRSFRRIAVAYSIEIENLSNQAQELIVLEASPVSQNEKIKVTNIKEEPKSIALDDPKRFEKQSGIFEWQIPLKPKQKSEINYENNVEFPADVQVSGLEQL